MVITDQYDLLAYFDSDEENYTIEPAEFDEDYEAEQAHNNYEGDINGL